MAKHVPKPRAAAAATPRREHRRSGPPIRGVDVVDVCRWVVTRHDELAATAAREVGHLARLLGEDLPLEDLDAHRVDAFIEARRVEGASDHTIGKELVALRASLKLARRAGLWRGDPGAVLPIGFAPSYKPRTRFLDREELTRLLGQLTEDRAARVAFVVATSARWGETNRARREDVTEAGVRLRGTKTDAAERTVPIVSPEQRSLLAYALRYAQGVDGALFRPWVTCNRDLRTACERAAQALQKADRERGGTGKGITFERCCMNDLRRTFATWLHADGAPLEILAPCMGHRDSRMLERVYARLPIAELSARLTRSLGTVAPVLQTEADSGHSRDSGDTSEATFPAVWWAVRESNSRPSD